jgi:hypothetical protein
VPRPAKSGRGRGEGAQSKKDTILPGRKIDLRKVFFIILSFFVCHLNFFWYNADLENNP